MASLTLSPLSSSTLHSLKPQLFLLNLKPSYSYRKTPNKKKIRGGLCKAEFSHDAPFAVAIGACMLNSLVFPIAGGQDDESDSVIDSTDTRLAAMGIISFIPYFNWLSWVFAWLDTGKRRYAVYSLVYLAPYLRSNLSLSPEESWLPITSIVLCVIHIQLEASIRNGDLQGFQLFNEAAKHLTGKNDIQLKGHGRNSEEGRRNQETKNLPSSEEQSKNEIRQWGVPKKPLDDPEHLNEDGFDESGKH